MRTLAFFVQLLVCFFSLFAQSTPQSTVGLIDGHRLHLKENDVRCSVISAVGVVYPRNARLAHLEGDVRVRLLVGRDGSVSDVKTLSGEPVLVESAVKAVRQWRFLQRLLNGEPVETELPLAFTFSIEDAPMPAYLHLRNGKVIRADQVREFTDGFDYVVGGRTHHVAAGVVTDVDTCAGRILAHPPDSGCVLSGGPSFHIRALPLLSRATK